MQTSSARCSPPSPSRSRGKRRKRRSRGGSRRSAPSSRPRRSLLPYAGARAPELLSRLRARSYLAVAAPADVRLALAAPADVGLAFAASADVGFPFAAADVGLGRGRAADVRPGAPRVGEDAGDVALRGERHRARPAERGEGHEERERLARVGRLDDGHQVVDADAEPEPDEVSPDLGHELLGRLGDARIAEQPVDPRLLELAEHDERRHPGLLWSSDTLAKHRLEQAEAVGDADRLQPVTRTEL